MGLGIISVHKPLLISMRSQLNITPPTRQNCCAIIVTFHPDDGFVASLDRIVEIFAAVVLIDNHSALAFRQQLPNFASPKLTVIQNSNNQGLARALNQGLDFAIAHQFAWACTFDQDSLINPNLLDTYIDLFQQASVKPMMIGCNYWHSALNKPFLKVQDNQPYRVRKTMITSGTLLYLKLAESIGYFREDYFIDSIDHEYSLRARKHGYQLLMGTEVLMHHSIGRTATFQRHKLFRIPEHSPLRKYYITRNSLTTAFNYFWYEPLWSLKQMVRLCVEFVTIVVYEQQKWSKISAMRLGIWHAITGSMGELKTSQQTWKI